MQQWLSRAGKGRVIALLALALIVRALVPTGWMPVASADGLRFQLCASQGPSLSKMTAHHGGKEHGKAALPEQPCAFAGLGLAADTAPPPLLASGPVTPAPTGQRPNEVVSVGHGLAAPPPPATGPPAFA